MNISIFFYTLKRIYTYNIVIWSVYNTIIKFDYVGTIKYKCMIYENVGMTMNFNIGYIYLISHLMSE